MSTAERLAARGRSVAVVDMHTIKPLDAATVQHWARRTGHVVTAENHSIVGGLGSAVAETLMEAGIHARFRRIGVRDTFAEGGSTPYLFRKYGLDAAAIEAALGACWGEVR
jgi:transketolase